MMLIAAADHPLAQVKHLTLSAVVKYPLISFGCIWVALVVYSVDLVRAYRRQQARSWTTG